MVADGLVSAGPAATDPLFAWEDGALTRRAVTRCALARVCGACGLPLGRPIAFVGRPEEQARNAFHGPPLHEGCTPRVLALVPDGVVVRTAGFEFVRPVAGDPDPAVRCVPNALL